MAYLATWFAPLIPWLRHYISWKQVLISSYLCEGKSKKLDTIFQRKWSTPATLSKWELCFSLIHFFSFFFFWSGFYHGHLFHTLYCNAILSYFFLLTSFLQIWSWELCYSYDMPISLCVSHIHHLALWHVHISFSPFHLACFDPFVEPTKW